MQVLEVRNGELIESITRQAAKHGISHAAIVALIGAADSFTVSINPAGLLPGCCTCGPVRVMRGLTFTMLAGHSRPADGVAARCLTQS